MKNTRCLSHDERSHSGTAAGALQLRPASTCLLPLRSRDVRLRPSQVVLLQGGGRQKTQSTCGSLRSCLAIQVGVVHKVLLLWSVRMSRRGRMTEHEQRSDRHITTPHPHHSTSSYRAVLTLHSSLLPQPSHSRTQSTSPTLVRAPLIQRLCCHSLSWPSPLAHAFSPCGLPNHVVAALSAGGNGRPPVAALHRRAW